MTAQVMLPFRLSARSDHINSVKQAEPLDLLIIGAGINGCGLARAATVQGLRVAVVDQGDLGSGTSSRSSRLIHGGLRYLEHYQFKLVAESTAYRWRLMKRAPHLVKPLPFLFPSYETDKNPLWLMKLGVTAYQAISLLRTPGPNRSFSREAMLRHLPGLSPEGLKGGVMFHDCSTDDGRLTLENALDAARWGALFFPRTRVTRGILEQGRLVGVEVLDLLDQSPWELRARVIINASGPWTDRVNQILMPGALPRWLRPTKGVHLVVPRDKIPGDQALGMLAAADQRPVFTVPWGSAVYLGTTDTDGELEEDPKATDGELGYLLDSINRYLPSPGLKKQDIISTWAGYRPLVWDEHAGASEVSREERMEVVADSLVILAGGKLTTYPLMAEKALTRALGLLERHHNIRPRPDPERLNTQAIGDPRNLDQARILLQAREGFPGLLSEDRLRDLVDRRGAAALGILALAARDPNLLEPAAPDQPWLTAELVWAMENEYAITEEDLLRRRTHLHYKAADQEAATQKVRSILHQSYVSM